MRGSGGRTHKFFGIPGFDDQRSLGTLPQAGPQTVAKLIRQQLRLAVHDLNGPFGARRHTQATAVTFILIYPNNLSFCHELTSSLLSVGRRQSCYQP
jgi:hypothetical protein